MPDEFNLPLASEFGACLFTRCRSARIVPPNSRHVTGQASLGVTQHQAMADLSGIAGRLELAYPRTNKFHGVLVTNFDEAMITDVTVASDEPTCAALFVLLLDPSTSEAQIARR